MTKNASAILLDAEIVWAKKKLKLVDIRLKILAKDVLKVKGIILSINLMPINYMWTVVRMMKNMKGIILKKMKKNFTHVLRLVDCAMDQERLANNCVKLAKTDILKEEKERLLYLVEILDTLIAV